MRKNSSKGPSTSGFTLIELTLVVAVIIIIASIALPNLLGSKLTANESSAIQTLRVISSGETGFVTRNLVNNDVPQDGNFEYGYLGELAGSATLRGLAAPMGPPTLGAKLGVVQNSATTTAGYHFAIFLPGPEESVLQKT